jgi:hypothetical protein
VKHATDAANEFSGSDRDRYLAAAQNLRIPYWDWARPVTDGQHVVPDSLSSSAISVNVPSGQVTIANPLYSYRFHPIDQRLGGQVSNFLDILEWHRYQVVNWHNDRFDRVFGFNLLLVNIQSQDACKNEHQLISF